MDQASQSVTVAEENKTYTVNFSNQRKVWKATVTKTDKETTSAQGDATLAGAVYGVYLNGTEKARYTTDSNGQFTTGEFPTGSGWTIKEITPPTGYLLDTTVYTVGAESGNFTVRLNPLTMGVKDTVIKGKVQITKSTYDTFHNTRQPENGAVFSYALKSDPGKVKGTFTSGADGVATTPDLPYGTYIIHQQSGAAGTDMMADFEVSITENTKTYTYSKDNEWWMATVEIYKHWVGRDNTPLTATFVLLNEAGTEIDRVTTVNGRATFTEKLIYGHKYNVQELTPPVGFDKDETLRPVECTSRNQVISLDISNTPSVGSVSVHKIDTQGNNKRGVSIALEYSLDNGHTWNPVTYRAADAPRTEGTSTTAALQGRTDGILVTGEVGMAIWEGLLIDNETTHILYRMTEVSTTSGSTLLKDTAWEGSISVDTTDVTVTVVNNNGYTLPEAGANDLALVSAGMIIFLLAISTLVFCSPKKREENK